MHLPVESEKDLNGQLLFYEPMIFHSVYMMISASEPCEQAMAFIILLIGNLM
jgi:hypothetical protein